MEEKTHTITCRLNEADFRKLKDEADAMELNTSDYIRLLTRLPVECKCTDDPDSLIIIDPRALVHLSYQLRKQGYLLNQATHALNTVALKVEHGSSLDAEMTKLIRKAVMSIEEIQAKIRELKENSEELMNRRQTFLDWYRRKPKRRG